MSNSLPPSQEESQDLFSPVITKGFEPVSPLEVELPESSTLADLVAHLGLTREELKLTFVNGRAQELEYHLVPGDEVGIFPPVGGG